MSDRSSDSTDRILCVCGRTKISHSHGNLWKCSACGRYHDGEKLDRLAEETRAITTDTDRDGGDEE